MPPPREADAGLIIRAFLDERDGFSPDYVVACPEANIRFLKRVRQLGAPGADADINRTLLNARKAGKLKGKPTEKEYRLPPEFESFIFASEWAVRYLQRQLVKETNQLIALDDLLVDPVLAARFDEIVARLKGGFKPLVGRWAALGLRKKAKSKLAPTDLKVSLERQVPLAELPGQLPSEGGLYLIRADEEAIYINHTDNLRAQFERHRESAGDQIVPDWLMEGKGRVTGVSFVCLPRARPERLRETRINGIAMFRPWLNLLDLDGAA